jgi:hypothetical protein
MEALNYAVSGLDDETRPVTHREDMNFNKLKTSLDGQNVKKSDLNNIINHIIRNRIKY